MDLSYYYRCRYYYYYYFIFLTTSNKKKSGLQMLYFIGHANLDSKSCRMHITILCAFEKKNDNDR